MISFNNAKEPKEQKNDNNTIRVFRTILNKYHKSGILKMNVQNLTNCDPQIPP